MTFCNYVSLVFENLGFAFLFILPIVMYILQSKNGVVLCMAGTMIGLCFLVGGLGFENMNLKSTIQRT